MPAVALRIVASNCARSSISSVEGHSANESNSRGGVSDGEAGLGWRKADERRGSLVREQTRRGT